MKWIIKQRSPNHTLFTHFCSVQKPEKNEEIRTIKEGTLRKVDRIAEEEVNKTLQHLSASTYSSAGNCGTPHIDVF
jgi:hypothetical protein